MPPKQNQYAIINIACKELGLDKYQLIGDRYGVESTKELTRFQTEDLISHLKNQGFKVKRGNGPASPRYQRADQRKVVALWIELAAAGVVNNRSHAALNAFVKKHTGVAELRWCRPDHTGKVIEILKSWASREGVDVK